MARSAVAVRLLATMVVLTALAMWFIMLAAASGATIPTAEPAAFTTAVSRVSPVDSTGRLVAPYTVGRRYTIGNCQLGSTYTGTAYRCAARQAPQGVLDPCWVTSSTDYVLCLTTPWTHTSVRVHVTGGYDNSGGAAQVHFAWGVELTPKLRCLRNVGGVAVAAGHAITYYCSNRTVIVGTLERGSATWHAQTYRRTKAAPHHYYSTGRRRISTAWFGLASRHG